MNPRCRIERVAVPPVGEAPWRVAGAQAALVEQSLTDWGFDDWAWGTADLMSFLRRERYERYELFVAILSAAPATTQDPDDVVGASEHRGRRLGLLLKTTQLLELGRSLPRLRRLHTWNAAENRHMLAINEAVGFTVTGHSGEWQRAL